MWATVDITDEECMTEFIHIAEACFVNTTANKPDPQFIDAFEALTQAQNLCKKLHPGNNNVMAQILHDFAIGYEDNYKFVPDKALKDTALFYEGEYDKMMQCIKQGIL